MKKEKQRCRISCNFNQVINIAVEPVLHDEFMTVRHLTSQLDICGFNYSRASQIYMYSSKNK